MKNIFVDNKKIFNYIVAGFLLAYLLPYLFLSSCAWLTADDYMSYVSVGKHNLFYLAYDSYMNWMGIWFGVLITGALFYLIPVECYFIYPLLMFTGIFFSFRSLIKDYYDKQYISLNNYALTSLLLVVVLTPATSEFFYWMSAAAYPVALMCFILFVKFLLRLINNEVTRSNIIYCVFFLICCSSCRYISSLAILVSLVCIITFNIFYKKSNKIFYYLFAVALICSMIVFLAPGNFARIPGLAHNIRSTTYYSARLIPNILTDIIKNPFIIFSLLLFTNLNVKTNKQNDKWFVTCILLLFVVSGFVLESAFLYYSYGRIAARTQGLLYAIYCIMILVLFLTNLQAWKIKFNFSTYLLLYFVILVGLYNNTKLARDDYLYRMFKFREECVKREEIISSNIYNGNLDVKVPKFRCTPKTVFFEDLVCDKSKFHNQSASKYYKINSIIIE